MKKYLYLLILAALAGVLLSGLMTFEHYYPELQGRVISCGEGVSDPCYSVSLSNYSTLFGLPVAALGLYFYLLLIFLLLVADYAGGMYYRYAALAVLYLSVTALAADVVLAALLVRMKLLCTHCIYSYGINLFVFIAALLWSRKIPEFSVNPLRLARRLFREPRSPHERASLSLALISSIMLFFAVFAVTQVLKIKTHVPAPAKQEVLTFVNEHYTHPVEKLSLPPSSLVLGNADAPVTIVVFTDFLCSACYHFYLVEKNLFARYPGKIRVVYYNYPLDGECNRLVRHSRYPGSCMASRAALAAGSVGMFPDFLSRHFRDLKKHYHNYSMRTALDLLSGLGNTGELHKAINSRDIGSQLQRDIDHAELLKINATPTLFINGRRMEGVPPKEILHAVVERELSRK